MHCHFRVAPKTETSVYLHKVCSVTSYKSVCGEQLHNSALMVEKFGSDCILRVSLWEKNVLLKFNLEFNAKKRNIHVK